MGNYAEHWDETNLDAALDCCRGTFQRDLIMGREGLSLATLRGKARNYKCRYQESISNLMARMRKNGVVFCEAIRDHGRRVLVIGTPVADVRVADLGELDWRPTEVVPEDYHA